jgi:hypothetical protein
VVIDSGTIELKSDKAKVETLETSIEGRTKAEIKALQTKIKTTMLDVSQ